MPFYVITHASYIINGSTISTPGIYGPDWAHSAVTVVGTYLIAALLPKSIQHRVAYVWILGYMVGAHAYRMYVSYLTGVFDFTGTQVCKRHKLKSISQLRAANYL